MFLIWFWFWLSFASAINLSDSLLNIGEELSIYGDGFGNSIDKYWWICFDDDQHCFVQGSDWLSLWSDKLIKLWVPSNIPLKWIIKIYVWGNLIWTTDYAIKPLIVDISDWNYVKKSAWESEKVLIQWKWFGSYPGSVYFWDNKANIVSWTENKIWLNIPKIKNMTNNFKVENHALILSDAFEFSVYPKISNDEYSSKQEYLSVLGVKDIW